MNLDKQDKNTNIRSFYDMIANRCLENQPKSPDLSADESILPYYGWNNSKQQMQNKPVRSGYKMWILAASPEYVVNFDP